MSEVKATREYLSKIHYQTFVKSSQFMAIYNSDTVSFLEINDAMKERLGSVEIGNIKTISSSFDDDIYLTLSDIPCRLKILAKIERGIYMAELFPAHTKSWNQNSDLVQLTDLTSDGVWEWFPSLNFEYMSQRFWDILGYDQKDMDESPVAWMSFINEDDKKMALKTFEKHIETKGKVPYHLTVRYAHKRGHEVFVLCRGSVVEWFPDGKPWRVLGTHTDVTDIVKKDAVEAQSVFIARMSHEIRSPICTILNECEMLQSESNTKVIAQTCQQLISLTDDILSLGNTKSEKFILEEKPANLHVVLTGCNKRHRLEAKKKGIRMRLSTGDLPDTVLMDIVKFNQVLDNLLNNAIKYSDSGVITIDVEYNPDDHACEVRVEDCGQGIPAAMHSRVFEEFVQGDRTMQGAGIGLTLTKTLSSLMGGNVVIEKTEVGVGTTMLFTSILPLPESVAKDDESKQSMRVLVVDDMAINRTILIRRLACIGKMGIECTEIVEATDGLEAYTKFKASEGNFQLILMDCLMPVVDGFEATVKIHDECERLGIEPVPVVAVTASVSNTIRDKCFQHGMNFVVTKPYTEQDLVSSIQACMAISN